MKSRLLLFFMLTVSAASFAQTGFDENIVTGTAYTTSEPQLVEAADVDGDGDLDVVAYGRGMNWYENVDGVANFGQKNAITATSGSYVGTALHTIDFDNDGDIDILGAMSNKITLYKNTDGLGHFESILLYTLGSTYPTLSTIPADVNGDGDMDILCFFTITSTPSQHKLVWYENDGAGNFGTQQVIASGYTVSGTTTLIAKDLDGDNDQDIVLGHKNSDKVSWLKNNGDNTFGAVVTISTTADAINSLTVSDIDHDGDVDILSASENDNQVVWYKNLDGLGNFSEENIIVSNAAGAYDLLITDINNDNSDDIVYIGTNEIGWVNNINAGASFGTPQIITNKVFSGKDVITADLDGDGKKDIISASEEDDKVAWYKHIDGNGNFGRQVVIARRIDSPNGVYYADIDGDNDIDLLVNSHDDAKITWLENVNGLGFYGKEHIITESVTTGNYPVYCYPSDIDGDGDMDILAFKDNVLFWYENVDGHGNYTAEHTINNIGAFVNLLRSADLDGDGDMDVLCGVYSAEKISWYKNLGSGTFGPEIIITDTEDDNGSLTSMEIADMDGDNDLDIIASSFNSETYYFKNTDGLGTFAYQYMSVFNRMQAVYPADVDGDGDKDIVAVDSMGGGSFDAVIWYENSNGLGNFTAQHDISTLSLHGNAIHAADIDNDGDMDVLTAGYNSTLGQLALYKNNGNGTFAARQMIQELPSSNICWDVNVADVDNDNDMDVLAIFKVSSAQTKVSLFKNSGDSSNTIQGKVLIDANTNGCSSDDVKGRDLMVIANNGSHNFATFTDHEGAYRLATTIGNFTTKMTSVLPDYFNTTPALHTFSFSGVNNSYSADFCIAPNSTASDLNVAVYPQTDLRAGFSTYYRIVYRNMGASAASGSINFEYDNAKLSFYSASQTVTSQTTNILTFDFTNLNPFETRTIDIAFSVFAPPVTNINDEVVSMVSINPLSGDETEDDNTFSLNQTVIGSYDPNDITCLEGNQVLIQDADKYLHYIIRFQNTGNASAINVKVENTLDSKLDWTSMQLESLSHNGRVEIKDGSEVTFTFDNIYLPDSTANEPDSHGFIAYKIKPLENVAVEDIVNNTADIRFDFNPPIVTNTAATQFVDVLSVAEIGASQFNIYPNPATNLVNIEGNTMIDKVSIIDLNGRVLKEINFNTPTLQAQLNITDLTNGMYMLKIKSNQGNTNRKIIKR